MSTTRRLAQRAITLIALTAATLVAAPPTVAGACSCAESTDAQARGQADVVFTGELVKVTLPDSADIRSSMDPKWLTFEVDRVYKGVAEARQVVVTPFSGASCGLEIEGPGTFLVYATSGDTIVADREDALWAQLCGGTRRVGERPVPAAFGPGRNVEPASSRDASADTNPVVPLAVALLVAAAAAGTVGAFRRRRRIRRTGS